MELRTARSRVQIPANPKTIGDFFSSILFCPSLGGQSYQVLVGGWWQVFYGIGRGAHTWARTPWLFKKMNGEASHETTKLIVLGTLQLWQLHCVIFRIRALKMLTCIHFPGNNLDKHLVCLIAFL